MFKNLDTFKIKKNKNLSDYFANAKFDNLSINCNILKGNFFSDSFNYFPITDNEETFSMLFNREYNDTSHFFTDNFYKVFIERKKLFKSYKDVFVLGTNAADNYYSNLLHFLPRIFFNKNKKIKLAIHRNSSRKFRKFIKKILTLIGTEFTYIYLDDDFYYFKNSEFPQFINLHESVKILKNFLNSKKILDNEKKIYVTRQDSNYRKIINEGDIISLLRKKGYKIINPQLYSIDEQIDIFSNAEKIIGPHGANLANIIFCKPGTEIIEIAPYFQKNEKIFEDRYLNLSLISKLKHQKILCDSVDIKNHSKTAKKYIHSNVLSQSNYYKNLIVKIQDLDKIQ